MTTPSPRAAEVEPDDETGAKPFLKWAGGKWSLAPAIHRRLPRDLASRTYREPFLGGGALFFWLAARGAAKRYVLSDALEDLVLTYEVVRDKPKPLVSKLQKLKEAHTQNPEDCFYRVREQYNERSGTKIDRATWLIYLNKTCYNGLYRTNRSGRFNVPIGRFERPNIADRERLLAASRVLKGAEIHCGPFEDLLERARAGDVVYLDPPYVPVSRTANFDSYAGGAFGPELQASLARTFRELDARGCLLVLSNSDTAEVRRLYEGFDLTVIDAPRMISSRTSTRGTVTELLVRNAARWPASAR